VWQIIHQFTCEQTKSIFQRNLNLDYDLDAKDDPDAYAHKHVMIGS
jgi:hypothetical protein